MRLHYLMLFSSDNINKLFRQNCYLLLYINIGTSREEDTIWSSQNFLLKMNSQSVLTWL